MQLIYNGNLIDASTPYLLHKNRSFRYGDGIFESMVMFHSEISLLPFHIQRMQLGAQVLELEYPDALSLENLKIQLVQLIEANQLSNARIRVFLFRDGDGFYAPQNNNAGYIIETESISNYQYEWNVEGLEIGIYDAIQKPVNLLSNIKSCNALLYVKAALYKNKEALDECVILNSHEEICESISSNIFWIKDGIIYTPSAKTGCILGVMRLHILNHLKANHIPIEECEATIEEIWKAEEVFLSGATKGIHWVKSLTHGTQHQEFISVQSSKLFQSLFR